MQSLSEINVVILGGGLGTRLQSVVRESPKVLASVNEKPFLEFLLNQLNNSHFRKIILCTGYLSDQIEKQFGKKYKKLNLNYSVEQSPLGTAGGLRNAYPLFDSETILVMNGDSYCKVDFKKFWQFHQIKKAKASILLTSVSDTRRYGKVDVRGSKIVGFSEKNKKKGSGCINAGIYLIDKNLIFEIPKDKKLSLEKDIFPNLVGSGFYGLKSKDKFIDIGTPESYEVAQNFFANYKI